MLIVFGLTYELLSISLIENLAKFV